MLHPRHLYWPLVAALSLPYLNWYSDWLDRLGKTPVGAHSRLQGWLHFLGWKLAHAALILGTHVPDLEPSPLSGAGAHRGWRSATANWIIRACWRRSKAS